MKRFWSSATTFIVVLIPLSIFQITFIFFGFSRPWDMIGFGIYIALIAYWSTAGTFEKEEKKLKLEVEDSKNKLEVIRKTHESIVQNKQEQIDTLNKVILEKKAWSPTLIQMLDQYEKIADDGVVRYLQTKSRPAYTAADQVKAEAARRRQAEKNDKQSKSIIEYYESIAPFLIDLKEEIIGTDNSTEMEVLKDYTDEEKQDGAIEYLSKDEYRNLPDNEKYQHALDRFWIRPKSKWMIGKIYERYVGYLYEIKGYDVEYVGIIKGYEDLGRDLICKKGNEIIVIQCKHWSKFSTIYEKHIFQFFGTVFQYKDENRDKNVSGIFYTTTKVSDLAKRFANELGISIVEEHKFDQKYPSIKCNINKQTKEKIYHLPFDQQYDKINIEINRGEVYCSTIKEAESHGFRKAFRWKGSSAK